MNKKTLLVMLSLLLLPIFLFANSMYVWRSGFNQYSNQKLIRLFKKAKVDTILISTHRVSVDKIKNFIKLAKKNKMKVEFLISNSYYIFPKNYRKIARKLKYFNQFDNNFIHLDIEPHALKSLKKDRERYLKMYVNMLNYFNRFNYKISISIPTFYNEKYVKEMAKKVDKIYFMDYGYKNHRQLLHRVDKYKLDKKKVVVALNCKDFHSKQQLQKDVNFLKVHHYNNVAYHNLRTYLKLR